MRSESSAPPVAANADEGSSEPDLDALDQHKLPHEVPIRQVRIAVSMVGGSALCLYENGVAQELFRMVHGQGLYGLLKRLTHSHAFTDILSGTSAGGINTILLSSALVAGSDFRLTQKVWIKLADIDALMQNPRDRRATTLLRGEEFYTCELEKVFDTLARPPRMGQAWGWNQITIPSGLERGISSEGEAAAVQYRDLDLFVTGTYYVGRLQTYFDARKQPVFTRNHAGVFHLKHRPRRNESHFHPAMEEPSDSTNADASAAAAGAAATKTPVTGATQSGLLAGKERRAALVSGRLARIARTTSSLPAVFEPSVVHNSLMQGVIALPRAKSPAGNGAAGNGEEPGNYILDGGFLNNRPLDLVLKEVYFRGSGSEVVRKVFLVEPDPELSRRELPTTHGPNAIESLLFYRNVSGYQSLSNYLSSIEEHNRRVQRVNETLQTTRAMLVQGEAEAQEGAVDPNLQRIWRALSLQSMRDEIVAMWEEERHLKDFDGLLDGDQVDVVAQRQRLSEEASALRFLRSALLDHMEAFFNPPPGQISAATYTLEDVDVTYLRRRIMRAQTEIYETLYPTSNLPQGAQHQRQDVVQKLAIATLRDEQRGNTSRNASDAADSSESARFLATQVYVRELFHLADLTNIVSDCMGSLMGVIAHSPIYLEARDAALQELSRPVAASAAAEPEADESASPAQIAMDRLWKLIVSALRLLVEDGRDEVVEIKADEFPAADDFKSRETAWRLMLHRHHWEAKHLGEAVPIPESWSDPAQFADGLHRIGVDATLRSDFYELPLPTRCRIICQAIALPDDFELEAHPSTAEPEKYRSALACCEALIGWTPPRVEAPSDERGDASDAPAIATSWRRGTVQSRLGARLNRNVQRAATELKPLFTAQTTHRLPLRWAYSRGANGNFEVLSPPQIGDRLRELDFYTFPVQRAADLDSLSAVEFVHLTPRSAQGSFARRAPEDKLAGDELLHFGGFLKASWRANDIMWGRLDAAVTIVDTLLDADRIRRLMSSARDRTRFVAEFMQAIDGFLANGGAVPIEEQKSETASQPAPLTASQPDEVGVYLARLFEADRARIEAWLTRPRGAREEAEGLEKLKFWLLQRCHLDILMQDMPDVLAQGLAEHARWRAAQNAPRAVDRAALPEEQLVQEGALEYGSDPSNRSLLLENMRQRVRQLFQNAPTPNSPTPNPPTPSVAAPGVAASALQVKAIADYFQNSYGVGAEKVDKNIPPLVMLRRISGLVLVALNVLEGCLNGGEGHEKIGKMLSNLLLKPLRLVFGALYGFACALEGGRTAQIVAQSVLWTVFGISAAALLLGIVGHATVLWCLMLISVALLILGDLIRNERHNVGLPLFLLGGVLLLLAATLPGWAPAQKEASFQTYVKWMRHFSPESALFGAWWLGVLLICAALFLGFTAHWRWRDAGETGRRMLVVVAGVWGVALELSLLFPGYNIWLGRACAALSQRLDFYVPALEIASVALLLAGGALIAYMNWLAQPLRTRDTPGGLISLALADDFESLQRYLQAWDASKRDLARKILVIDIGGALGYAGLAGAALLLGLRIANSQFANPQSLLPGDALWLVPPLWLCAAISPVMCGFDWWENVILWRSLRLSDEIADELGTSAPLGSRLRFNLDDPRIGRALSSQQRCSRLARWRWTMLFSCLAIVLLSAGGYLGSRRFVATRLQPAAPATAISTAPTAPGPRMKGRR